MSVRVSAACRHRHTHTPVHTDTRPCVHVPVHTHVYLCVHTRVHICIHVKQWLLVFGGNWMQPPQTLPQPLLWPQRGRRCLPGLSPAWLMVLEAKASPECTCI